MPTFQILNSFLPQLPTYTILFLPQMPLRLPPPTPALSMLRASMLVTFHMLPDGMLGVAVSCLAVAVGFGAVKRRYRVKRALNSSKHSVASHSCSDAREWEEKRARDLVNEPTLVRNEAECRPMQVPTVSQLMTPPPTPPRPVRSFRALSPTPHEPPNSNLDPATPCPTPPSSHILASPLLNDTPMPPTALSGSHLPANPVHRIETTTNSAYSPRDQLQSNPLPSNLVYTNTNYATLLHTQKLIAYERSRRDKLEAEARAELNALLKVYWSGVKARAWDKRRRERRREAFAGRNNSEVGREEVGDGFELKEEADVKQKIRLLQKRVVTLREEKFPYEDILYPSPSPTAYRFENGALTTTPSARISPSHLLSIFSDPVVAAKVEEVSVALGLWAGWDWDVEQEWHFEAKAWRQRTGRRVFEASSAMASQPEDDHPSSAVSGKALKLSMLRKFIVSTQDVPLGMLFERVALAPGSLVGVQICIEDIAKAARTSKGVTVSGDSPPPSKGTKFRTRLAGQSLLERKKEEVRQKVARCLEGLSESLSQDTSNLELCLPDGVENMWTKTRKGDSVR